MGAFYPDPDISLEDFFESFVPERFVEERGAELLPPGPLPWLYVEVDGAGWSYTVRGGELVTEPGPQGAPVATVRLSEEDWRDGVSGALAGGYEPTEADRERLRKRAKLTQDMVRRVEALRGRIRFVVRHFAGRDWTLEVVLGPEAEASKTATLSIGAMDCEAILAGRKDPIRAWTSGEVEVEGAEGLAVQLLTIFLPELAGLKRKRR